MPEIFIRRSLFFLTGVLGVTATISILLDLAGQPNLLETRASYYLLVVDYLSGEFEGGIQVPVNALRLGPRNPMPLDVIYEPPMDFGGIQIVDRYSGSDIFRGSIVWAGSGRMHLPRQLAPPEVFPKSGSSAPAMFRALMPINDPVLATNGFCRPQRSDELLEAWSSVSNLAVFGELSERYGGIAPIGYLLYTPGVGIGDPADYKWVFIAYADGRGP